MNAMPLPLLFSIVGCVSIVALYFMWGRKSAKS